MGPRAFTAVGARLCGVDEAGRGPVLGPLVVAALAVDDDGPLRALGVRDSKKLTPRRREALVDQITALGRHELVVVPAEVLDRVRDNRSLNQLEAEVFAAAISALDPEAAYVDAADVSEEHFRSMVQSHLRRPILVVSEHFADDTYPIVSAASILAKVTRDREMRRIGEELGQPVGSGYCHDPVTVEFLRRWLRFHPHPPPYCRTSWETTRRLIGEASLRRISDFGGQ